ncbi:hypothetical protein [Arthrobacter sp. NPDC057009]|uniref:hypothetical protein n=1 Tax=Arthrobacter sp. NPDC057009 TaxID=3345996 RepID=UPI00363E9CA4
MLEIQAGAPAQTAHSGKSPGILAQILKWARTAAVPYRIGDVLVGDDPFNGRREGTVVVKNGRSIGIRSSGRVYFYDYRQLRRPD